MNGKLRYLTFAEPPNRLTLESGKSLGPITVAYETFGELNARRDNAILVLHALSGDSHPTGYSTPSTAGWWDNMIGPGKPLDTDRYFVICSNVLGGCSGTTGPSSVNPETGEPYALSFPVITVLDMVEVQKILIDHLKIDRLLGVIGGSLGGMQALQWAVTYPERVKLVIPIATTSRLSPQAIAFNAVGRQAIMSDPDWRNGDYYGKSFPFNGLSIARMIGHITYLSDQTMHQKFGRRLLNSGKYGYDFKMEFEVESYLNHQGNSFVNRFDANSYLYLTKAMDYFDLPQAHGTIERAFANTRSRFLLISFSSDWLFPTYQLEEIAHSLPNNDHRVVFSEIATDYGHDSFLLESEELSRLISTFLSEGYHSDQ